MPKKPQATSPSEDLNSAHVWTRKEVYMLLELYYQRLHKFRDHLIMKKIVWLEILKEMHLAGYRALTWKGLDRKMRNLKRHFFYAKQHKGANSSWEYYGMLSSIYDDPSEVEITGKVEVKTENKNADEICASTEELCESMAPDTEAFCDDLMQEDCTHDTKSEYDSDDAPLDCLKSRDRQLDACPSRVTHDHKKKRTGVADAQNGAIESIMRKIDESNRIQRERNMILKQILNKLK